MFLKDFLLVFKFVNDQTDKISNTFKSLNTYIEHVTLDENSNIKEVIIIH